MPIPHPFGPDASEDFDGYQEWLEKTERERNKRAQKLRRDLVKRIDRPLISLITPTYKTPLRYIKRCVDSVIAQAYDRWELCICDDGSNSWQLSRYLKGLPQRDSRIKVQLNKENGGISHATNGGLAMASGDFIFLLDHDDEIPAEALIEIAHAIHEDSEIDIVYSDEDKIDEDGVRFAPWFKPGWSPDHLLTHPYMTHGLAIRKRIIDDLGGMRSEFDGSQDYDLILRASEVARKIHHIPRILYHWRTIEGSTASDEMAKPWAHDAAQRALQNALDRRGADAVAEVGNFRWAFRVRPRIKDNPLISIVIPFRDEATLLRKCVDSIEALAGYENWEAVLVNNGSWEPETKALLKALDSNPRIRILDYPHPFNWSALNNWAKDHCLGEVLLFLNNDIEGVSEGWLLALLEAVQRSDVGAVGSKLLYPDGRIQHAGILLGVGSISAHSFWFMPPERHGYFAMDKIVRNYSAVTGACMMVRRRVFEEIGGFDESLGVAFNDVDFCLKLLERGYVVVYTPFAELVHYESASRGLAADRPEKKIMVDRWFEFIKKGDPYYNPNLSHRRYDFGLPYPNETLPWKDLKSMFGS